MILIYYNNLIETNQNHLFFRIYKLKFNCFSSCLEKEKDLPLYLNVTPLGPDNQPALSRTYTIPLIVSANPGRDSGLFKGQRGIKTGVKRSSPGASSGLSGIPMKREPVWNSEPSTSRAGASGEFLTPVANQMLQNFSDADKAKINFRIKKLIEAEVDISHGKIDPS